MRAKRRVVFLCPTLEVGGAERSLLVYLEHLDRSRFEPHLVLLRREGLLEAEVPADIPIYDLQRPAYLGLATSAYRFYGLMKELGPDIVVSFLWYADAVQLLARWVPGSSWSAVVTIHNLIELTAGERWGGIKLELLARLYPKADLCVAVSSAVAVDFQKYFAKGCRPPTEVLYNPRSISGLRELAECESSEGEWTKGTLFEPGGERVHLVAVGRLVYEKGYDVLLQALSRISSDSLWTLSILGDGPELMPLRELGQTLGIGERVRFLGHVANPFPHLAKATIFVLPSRSEGLPGAVCEAMALGLPIVASNVGGVAELLNEGTSGVLVPASDVPLLATALSGLMGDPQRRQALGRAALKSAAVFDADRVLSSFESLLDRL